uniref:Uncharacterized protein n=1 Tax=Oryza punctata TaxID=4537 RepID=A0A0E0MDV8_ORYPU
MQLGHEQADVPPPRLYARSLDSAGTSSCAINGRCVFCARQEHNLLPVYNAAPHVPPVDNAAAERLKELIEELETCRPFGMAAMALVMSIGLFVASTSNILSKVVKFWSVGLLVIYNSPFMAHLRKITCAGMTGLLKVLLAILTVGVVLCVRNGMLGDPEGCNWKWGTGARRGSGIFHLGLQLGGSSRNIPQLGGVSSRSIPQMVGVSSSRGSLSSPPWGMITVCNSWWQKQL